MDFTNPIHEKFFKHVWPDMEYIGEKLDKYHRYPRSPLLLTVYGHKIKFYDKKNKERNWKVKHHVLSVIAEKS